MEDERSQWLERATAQPDNALAQVIACAGMQVPFCRRWLPAFRAVWGTPHHLATCLVTRCDSRDHALVVAARVGLHGAAEVLLDWGANVHYRSDEALCRASYEGHIEVVRLLLNRGAKINAVGAAALYWSASQGHVEVVRLLLDRGAKINGLGSGNVLHWPAINGHVEVVQLLLDRGADIRAGGRLALGAASTARQQHAINLLRERGA